MIFKELTKEEFNTHALNHPQFTFHQTPNWAKLKSNTGWKSYYVGVKENDEVIASALLLLKNLPIKKNMLYSPRGLLVDYKNKELLSFFTKNLKEFAKKHNAIFVKIDPYIPYKERDKDGNLVEGGFDNSEVVNNLIELGYRHNGFNLYFENVQPRWTSVLDIKDKTYEEIESGFMATLRKELRQHTRNGIYTRELRKDELSEFIRLADATGDRKGYGTRPLSYYESMWDALYPDYMKMCITFMNFKKAKEVTQGLIDEIYNARKENEEKAKQGLIKINEKKAQIKAKEEDTAIANYKKNLEAFDEMINKYGEEIPVSSLLWLTSPKEMICLSIGNDKNFMRYKTSFSAYTWGIKYAIEHHMERYNFYGITGNFSKDNPDYGLFEMKQRFGATVEELIGEFDLITSPLWYKAYRTALRLRKVLRK